MTAHQQQLNCNYSFPPLVVSFDYYPCYAASNGVPTLTSHLSRTPYVVAFSAIFLFTFGCDKPKTEKLAPKTVAVGVSQPVITTMAEYGTYTGFVEAVQRVEIRPQVRGRLHKIHFQEGSTVAKGTLLYEIDPEEYRVIRDGANAELERAEADLIRALAEEDRAKASLQRLRNLGEGGISKEELDQAVATYKTAVAAHGQAKAAIEQARAKLNAAELDLSFTKIFAPISGRISRSFVTEGNLVGYNEPTLLTVMVDQDPIDVFFDVPEREAIQYEARVKPLHKLAPLVGGLSWRPLWSDAMIPAEVAIETEEGYPHAGVLNFREPRFESETGTVRIRARLDNPDLTLSSGMYARIRFPTTEPQDRLTISMRAIMSDQQGRYVFVVDDENVVQYRPVKLGSRLDDLVAIESGLSMDDWVIVEGIQNVKPRDRVIPEQVPMPDMKIESGSGNLLANR